MKTLFLSLMLGFTSALSYSQTSEHLSFKGVPIDGTLSEFVSKMKINGFTHVSTEKDAVILNGDFAGYKDCNVTVSTLKQRDLVYKIDVHFPKKDTWSKLSNNYFELKDMLTEKYGKPSNTTEIFDGNSQPGDDQDRMYNVKTDRCKYYSIWKTDKGEIKLSIDHNSRLSCFVNLAYFDKINGNKIKATAKDDL